MMALALAAAAAAAKKAEEEQEEAAEPMPQSSMMRLGRSWAHWKAFVRLVRF
jgi:hypothetical protein